MWAIVSPVTAMSAIVPVSPIANMEVAVPWSGIAFGTSALTYTAWHDDPGVAVGTVGTDVALLTAVEVLVLVRVDDATAVLTPVRVGVALLMGVLVGTPVDVGVLVAVRVGVKVSVEVATGVPVPHPTPP